MKYSKLVGFISLVIMAAVSLWSDRLTDFAIFYVGALIYSEIARPS